MRRTALGAVAALAAVAALTAAMFPVRHHLSIATAALVLVIPVVVGVMAGGFTAGIVSVVAGFLAYDFFFIPPVLTFWVGAPQNWVVLGVYAMVMLLVSRVVAGMDVAKAEARRQGREIAELFGLSHLLVEDKPLDLLLPVIVRTVAEVFQARQVALLLPQNGQLAVAASAGEPLSDSQLRRVQPVPGALTTFDPMGRDDLRVLVLAAAGRPVGLLVLSGEAALHHDREPLLLFANHIALAIERVQLRDEAVQTRLAEEVARLAKTLVGAVSHDLRSPLSRIKASSSTLVDPGLAVDPEKARRLARLIDNEADRMATLVQNLLDMSRIQAGVLRPRHSVARLTDLVDPVVADLSASRPSHHIVVELPGDLPPIDADLVLVSRVLTNLLDNALRFSPRGMPVSVRARFREPEHIEILVTDHGPGVSPQRRNEIFELFSRRDADAGAGLGLAIAKIFVEAHGQRIWVDEAPDGGAIFHFTVASAAAVLEESGLAASAHR